MTEKKRPSIAEILAAARKSDKAGGSPAGEAASAPAAPETPAAPEAPPDAAPEPAAESPAAAEVSAPAPQPPVAKPKPSGARPSVAEMLAMARSQDKAGPAAAAPKKESPKEPPAPKPAAAKEKPAAKPIAEKKIDGKAAAPVRDTASILSAARGGTKPGPMSKAEAAAVAKPAAVEAAKPAKAKIEVPPMPPRPAAAKPKAAAAKAADAEERRWFIAVMLGTGLGLGFATTAATFGLWTLGFARFMFPNILTEPPSRFKVGFPGEFPPGAVEEKYKAQFGVWVVNTEYKGVQQIFALKTVCTHLGCTPNWLEAEQKFKCPCHGSGFYKDGINFEGPAPRPLERYAIVVGDDGQLEVDKSKLFQEELGQWADTSSFVPA